MGSGGTGGAFHEKGRGPLRRPGRSGHASIGLLTLLMTLGAGLCRPERSWGQQTPDANAAQKEAAPDPSRELVEPLGERYHFTETYGLGENPAKPYLINQYQVGVRDIHRIETEKAQGAPDRAEGTLLLIYTERPAQVSKLGETTDAVRRYDHVRLDGAMKLPTTTPPFLEGLKIWYQLRPGVFPEIISLTEGRILREQEHDAVINDTFLPTLSLILPSGSKRVGDKWSITRQAGRALLGRSVPDDGEFQVEGTLLEVRRAAAGTTRTAEFEISGELELDEGRGAVKARVEFAFEPPAGETTPKAARSNKSAVDRGIVEARGWISKIRMGRVQWLPIDDKGRLKRNQYRDTILERRPVKPSSPPLDLPQTAPIANEDNSWVLFDDPRGRLHFRHPQNLVLNPFAPPNPNQIHFIDERPSSGEDALIIVLPPKKGDPQDLAQFRNPDAMRRELTRMWDELDVDIVPGHSGWLPEADWAPSGRKVYHYEVAARKSGPEHQNEPRMYAEYYLVLFQRNIGIQVEAMTRRDDHMAFRKQVETLIKSLELGPYKGGFVAQAARPAPSAAPGQAPGADSPPAANPTPPPATTPEPPASAGPPTTIEAPAPSSAGSPPARRPAPPAPPIPPR
jgi:hypothetical protein